jgi:hypothetical protein
LFYSRRRHSYFAIDRWNLVCTSQLGRVWS